MLCLRGLKRFTKANTDLIPVCIASLCGVCVSSLCYCVGSRAVLRFPPPVQRHAYEVVIGNNKLAECVASANGCLSVWSTCPGCNPTLAQTQLGCIPQPPITLNAGVAEIEK